MFRRNEKKDYSRGGRLLLYSAALMTVALWAPPAKAQTRHPGKADFCSHLGKTFQASSGAQMYCFGPQPNGPGEEIAAQHEIGAAVTTGLPNVDAASLSEDRTNSGAYIGGQSETSISAAGNYVVEEWNDGTGFYAGCGSPNYKEELSGYGFSSNGGVSFTDLGGLPNQNCVNGTKWAGDPSVGRYTNSGFTYFYLSSLYECVFSSCPAAGLPFGGVAVAVSACQATGSTLSCGQPTIVATGNCHGVTNTSTSACFPFLDKDYLVVDEARKRLYVTFTDFTETYSGTTFTFYNEIDMAACDLDDPLAPVCSNGTTNGPHYAVVQPTDPAGCEQEGAYPAVRRSTGDVYVGFEYNWVTNYVGNSTCVNSAPTLVVVADVPGSCLPDPDHTPVSSCAPGSFNENANLIISTDATVVPGYNRFQMNDFPRIAVSEPYKSVSLVWNDSRDTPLGDILLQSYDLDTLNYIQGSPVRLNSAHAPDDMHTMPALKNSSSDGLINVTWYDRHGANADTGNTDIYGALNVNPTTSSTPSSNTRITNESTNWLATSSVIVPNFGDYTDNFVTASNTLFVAWSDGRSGVPQPFEAHTGVH